MEIRIGTDRDRTAWNNYVLSHANGVAYHHFAWMEAIERAYGFKTYPLMAEEGEKIKGVFPLAHFRRLFCGGELVSLPYCDAGGVLADSEKTAQTLLKWGSEFARRLGVPSIHLRSANKIIEGTQPHPNKVRMILPLPGSSEELFAGFKAKLRSQIRKPEKDGLRCVLGGIELLNDFFRVFSENMRDLGSPVHSRRWIEEVIKGYGEAARVGVVSMPDGTPAAAGIILCHPRMVSIPWASSLRRHNRWNPNMLLYWSFLSFAADEGHRSFDFGRSTVEEGTYRFKKQWGAEESPMFWAQYPPKEKKLEEDGNPSWKRQFAAKCWSQVPLAFANLLGPCVRKNISL